MAVLKRTMDRAPTIPRDRMMFDVIARIIRVVIMVMAIIETPKDAEYITPEKVFLYTKKMKSPIAKAISIATKTSTIENSTAFSKKLDLKISLNVIICYPNLKFLLLHI